VADFGSNFFEFEQPSAGYMVCELVKPLMETAFDRKHSGVTNGFWRSVAKLPKGRPYSESWLKLLKLLDNSRPAYWNAPEMARKRCTLEALI